MLNARRLNQKLSSPEDLTFGDQNRYAFRTKTFAYSALVVLLYRYEYMGGLLAFPSDRYVGIIEFFIISSFLILPILYMSLFIGHYSKLGCLVFGRIVPITYGVEYTMLIITVIQAVYSLIIACDSLTFLYSALGSNLPWMECDKEWGSDCIGFHEMEKCSQFDNEKSTNNCYTDITQLSTFKYRVYVLQQFPAFEQIEYDRFWNKIDGKRVGYLVVCVLAVLLFADLTISGDTKSAALIFFLYCVAIVFFIVVNFIQLKSYRGVFDIFKISEASLFDIQTWYDAVSYFIKVMNLANVGPVLLGSYLPKHAMADLQAFISWLSVLFLYLLGEFLNGTVRTNLAAKLNTSRYNLDVTVGDALSIFTPQLYGSLPFSPAGITSIFLSVIVITSVYHIKLLLAICYHTLADAKPIIRAYRFYIRIFSCLFLMVLAFPICIVNVFKRYFIILAFVEECLTVVVLIIICFAVLYVYGTQTLFDDHHFTYGSQPAIFFKVTLLVAPVVLIVFGAMMFMRLNTILIKVPDVGIYMLLIVGVCLCPQIIGLLYIMTYYLKRQNMAHLLRSEDNWGDPNPQTRKERIIYHPRKETNYFRRIDVCKQHKCLRHNKIHPVIVKNENILHKDAYRFIISTRRFSPEYGLKARDFESLDDSLSDESGSEDDETQSHI